MLLITYYLSLVALGNLSAYGIGWAVERMWGPNASLVTFLTLYFLTLWIAWVVAVRLTQPRRLPASA
jgi:hypothetical protein